MNAAGLSTNSSQRYLITNCSIYSYYPIVLTRKKISGDWRLLKCGCGGGWKRSAGGTWKQMKRYTTIGTRKKKSYGFNLEKEEILDQSYTQRWKPAKEGDIGSDDRKKTKGKKTIGYSKRVPESSIVCGINIEAKNLPNGRTLTTTQLCSTVRKIEPNAPN